LSAARDANVRGGHLPNLSQGFSLAAAVPGSPE